MTRKIADVRRDYEGGRLEEAQTPDNPFVMFDEWFSLACCLRDSMSRAWCFSPTTIAIKVAS